MLEVMRLQSSSAKSEKPVPHLWVLALLFTEAADDETVGEVALSFGLEGFR